MEKISRRQFLKRSLSLGAGALLMIYSDGSYRLALAQAPAALRMRVLHTNDHHARLEPVMSGSTPKHGGVARRKTLIDQVRASEALPLLLLDAGDVFQGTLFFNKYNGMADLEFYNAMGYEAMTLGNHEFDKGTILLADFIKRANFPVLSANVHVSTGSVLDGLYLSHIILEKGGKKIGIFGLTPEDTGELSNTGTEVQFTSAVAAAKEQVAALQAAGVFTIIGLTHVGIDMDRRIAREVSGISLIIGGHSHTPMGPMSGGANLPYPELIAAPDGKPVVIVTDWEWGRWLGDMTIAFNQEGTIVDVQGNPTEVLPSIEADPSFQQRIDVLAEPINQLRTTVIGSSSVELDGLRDHVRTRETNLGNLIADTMLIKTRNRGGQIAITNGGGIRASIPAGSVTVGDILEVLPFGNTLATVDITGAQVWATLENGVSQVENAAGRFPQIAGFSFTYDPALPAGSRVTSVTYAGEPMAMDAIFRVVTNNFMLGGGDGYTTFAQGSNQLDTGLILSDVVQEYLSSNSPISAVAEGRISIGRAIGSPTPSVTPTQPPASGTPHPIPATLPNTSAGVMQPLGLLASLGASALAGGWALRRRTQTTQPSDTAVDLE